MNGRCASGRTNWKSNSLQHQPPTGARPAEKARYLIGLFAATASAQDPRRQTLIKAVLRDFERLSREC